jgi:hypothetical protein
MIGHYGTFNDLNILALAQVNENVNQGTFELFVQDLAPILGDKYDMVSAVITAVSGGFKHSDGGITG